MARVTGYKIKLTAFLPAEPFNLEDLRVAGETFKQLSEWLNERGFVDQSLAAEPGSKRVPDKASSPLPAEDTKGAASQAAGGGEAVAMGGQHAPVGLKQHSTAEWPEMPANLKRTS